MLLMGTKEIQMQTKTRKTRKALFVCNECGRKFYSLKAAEKASFGPSGCPGCGGSDIEPNYL